jgi:hypothetical protein
MLTTKICMSCMTLCKKSGCHNYGNNTCSKCLKNFYCSRQCQIDDWKFHKIICCYIKDSTKLLSYSKLQAIASKILGSVFDNSPSNNIYKPGFEKNDIVNILVFCVSYFEFQFDDIIKHNPSNMRGSTKELSYYVDIKLLYLLYDLLGMLYYSELDSNNTINHSLCTSIYYFDKCLSIITYWQNKNKNKNKNNIEIEYFIDNNKVNKMFSSLKEKIGLCYEQKTDFDEAIINYDESVMYLKLISNYDSESIWKIDEYKARCFYRQSKFNEAKCLVEELYNKFVTKYNPAHISVLRIAELLIKVLIQLNRLYDAERFAEVTYTLLVKSNSPDSLDVAIAAANYARAIYYLMVYNNNNDNNSNTDNNNDNNNNNNSVNIIKIEMLSRKAIHIMDEEYHDIYVKKRNILVLLYKTLRLKNANLPESIEELELITKINFIDMFFSNITGNTELLDE